MSTAAATNTHEADDAAAATTTTTTTTPDATGSSRRRRSSFAALRRRIQVRFLNRRSSSSRRSSSTALDAAELTTATTTTATTTTTRCANRSSPTIGINIPSDHDQEGNHNHNTPTTTSRGWFRDSTGSEDSTTPATTEEAPSTTIEEDEAAAEAALAATPGLPATHYNVSCDECGVMPIVGCRYHSRLRPNYDVCQVCLQENYVVVATRACYTTCRNTNDAVETEEGQEEHVFVALEREVRDITAFERQQQSRNHLAVQHNHHPPNPNNADDHPREENTTILITSTLTVLEQLQQRPQSVTLHSFYELIDLLREEEELKQDDATAHPSNFVRDISLYIGTRTLPDTANQVRTLLATNTTLQSIHIYVFGTYHATEIIQPLAQGLAENTSILTVAWHVLSMPSLAPVLPGVDQNETDNGEHDNGLGISQTAARSLQHLMETNTTIRFMFFKYNSSSYYGSLVAQPPRRPGGLNVNVYSGRRLETLERALFTGLQTTHLHTFRYEGPSPVGRATKHLAWAAMQDNPRLRRIKAVFRKERYEYDNYDTDDESEMGDDSEDDIASHLRGAVDHDYWLDWLTLQKRHRWMDRWTTTTTADDKSTQTATKWSVLEEALEHYPTSPGLDPEEDIDVRVPVLYEFLRRQPEWFLPSSS